MSLTQLDVIIGKFSAMKAGWSETVTLEQMRADLEALHLGFAPAADWSAQPVSAGGVPAEWVDVKTTQSAVAQRAVLYLHGGGFAVGSIAASRHFSSHLAAAAQARVLVLGYRLAPEHVFPAQIDDALTAYRWLLAQGYAASKVAVAGDSAGGGLALSLLGGIAEQRLQMPGCAVLLTPWADMRCAGGSYERNKGADPVANREMAQMMAATYLGEKGKVDDARATPVMGSFSGFPPLLIQAAGRDVFLDDARAIDACARKYGIASVLEEWPEMIHQWQVYVAELEEGQKALHGVGSFIRKHTSR